MSNSGNRHIGTAVMYYCIMNTYENDMGITNGCSSIVDHDSVLFMYIYIYNTLKLWKVMIDYSSHNMLVVDKQRSMKKALVVQSSLNLRLFFNSYYSAPGGLMAPQHDVTELQAAGQRGCSSHGA